MPTREVRLAALNFPVENYPFAFASFTTSAKSFENNATVR